MIKTKLIMDTDWSSFEQALNNFIVDKKVIDIKYSSVITDVTTNITTISDRALVIYEECITETCRDRLRSEHPDLIYASSWGGCYGCPDDYGYLPKPEYCSPDKNVCTRCWDRVIDKNA